MFIIIFFNFSNKNYGNFIVIDKKEIINNYPFDTYIQSTQNHTLCHIDQSRDYRKQPLYNVLNTIGYNFHQTTLLCTLFN